jgi:hypothetical protein
VAAHLGPENVSVVPLPSQRRVDEAISVIQEALKADERDSVDMRGAPIGGAGQTGAIALVDALTEHTQLVVVTAS